ncbi:uncharacterized protein LOC110943790 [Helianthus annuus]|uniref:uncharacterized protein LOC110943790 n=1 Tax=Helianthus annuus TaxID=4232 RepID=UPI000B906AA0|nr:uncharacterized protein LOC110943790 [Helianthus annuus]
MEAYVDDLVIQSKTKGGMLNDIQETFRNLRKINMKLNPSKCSFGFEEGKFLGHIVGKQNIKANPNTVKAILETKYPQSKKDVERLRGKLAALKRFTSKLAERSLPFFKTLQGCTNKKHFRCTEEAEEAFNQMKRHLAPLPDIVAPTMGELISVYLRLWRYFQAHPIQVVTDQPIKSVLERPETSGRLAKWSIELGEHKITYVPRKAVKAQVLADFIVEIPNKKTTEVNTTTTEQSDPEAWKLFTDGASSLEGLGAGFVLINPESLEFTYALRFEFQATNNKAEYEALIAGLKLAKKMEVQKLQIFTDSLLVSNQVNDNYVAKEPSMKKYREKAKELMGTFQSCTIKQIPRSQNKKK